MVDWLRRMRLMVGVVVLIVLLMTLWWLISFTVIRCRLCVVTLGGAVMGRRLSRRRLWRWVCCCRGVLRLIG